MRKDVKVLSALLEQLLVREKLSCCGSECLLSNDSCQVPLEADVSKRQKLISSLEIHTYIWLTTTYNWKIRNRVRRLICHLLAKCKHSTMSWSTAKKQQSRSNVEESHQAHEEDQSFVLLVFHSVEKREITLAWKENFVKTSQYNPLISRNFCKCLLKVNFRNFHTVPSSTTRTTTTIISSVPASETLTLNHGRTRTNMQ